MSRKPWCVLCDPDESVEVKWYDEGRKERWLWVGEFSLVVHTNDYDAGYIPINFCPYCGRNLLDN